MTDVASPAVMFDRSPRPSRAPAPPTFQLAECWNIRRPSHGPLVHTDGAPAHRTLVAVFALNEGVKLRRTLGRFPVKRDYDLLLVDDGSTDGACDNLPNDYQCHHLRSPRRLGIGASMRRAIVWARERRYDTIVMMAGNDKDRPDEIPRLLQPLRAGSCSIVQGSRYLPGGTSSAMPLYRRAATRWVHPLLMRLACGRRLTDTTNGFRAIRLDLFDDPRVRIEQSWLDGYELEPYLLATAIRLGYRVVEAPVSKIYPARSLGYTKMRPFADWWNIIRPLLLLWLGLKR